MKGRIVDKEAMGLLPVFSESLPVISAEHNQGTVVCAPLLQIPEQASQLSIGECNFAIVRIGAVFLIERRWRVVGMMWVINMNPQEKWTLSRFGQPFEGMIDHIVRRSLHKI